MASLKLEHIYKVYPNGHKAVTDFNMDIKDGEFIVFVGPSGCGKSTTLRMIAGLEEISAGELYIGDTLVNDMEPKDRDIAMVFQNYALYPHMTVYENMAFGLTLRKTPRSEIHEKVMWAADALGLRDYLDRKPKAMSGGQRQRVSLGRAILRNPKVMLLDEPLSNLDAKLRSEMRSVISKLHQSLATTFIYVTHDQVEAMTLGTRVCVMKLGRIQQVDTPQNLYAHPANKFVAGFIGTPQMNFFNVTIKEGAKDVEMNWVDANQPALKVDKDYVLKAKKKYLQGDIPVTLGFRCEAVSVEPEEVAKGDNLINVTISHFEELGNETLIYGDLKEISGLGRESKTTIIIKATSKHDLKPGDVVKARIDVTKIHLFDNKDEKSIIPAIPNENVLDCSIVNNNMTCFGVAKKPDAIICDFLEKGSISIPLKAISLGDGELDGVVKSVEKINDSYLALVNVKDQSIFVMADEKTKAGAKVKIAIDYSLASLFDDKEQLVVAPLAERDDIHASFVNFKTAFEVTQDQRFVTERETRVDAVLKEFKAKEDELAKEKAAALEQANKDYLAIQPMFAANKVAMNKDNANLKKQIAELSAKYKKDLTEAKVRHEKIKAEAIKAIENQYATMIENETKDYKLALATNRDPDAKRARKLSYQLFKENLPQQKKNDIENKLNSLAFDSETELNGLRAHFSQEKYLLSSKIKESKDNFFRINKPVEYITKVYEEKEAKLAASKKDALLHAELLFFFKYDNYYQVIPADITNKIIQGVGNKVFTKTFRISTPHTCFEECEGALNFKVTALVNYGDVKLYKCVGSLYEQQQVVYIRKTRDIPLGSNVSLRPSLKDSEVYETGLNIRLY